MTLVVKQGDNDDERPGAPEAPSCGKCQWVWYGHKWQLSVHPDCARHSR